MPQSIVYRMVGPSTYVLATSQTQVVSITARAAESSNYLALTNISGPPVFVTIYAASAVPFGNLFPTTTSGPVDGVMVPSNMNQPMLIAAPAVNCKVAAVNQSTAPTALVIAPAAAI